VPFYVVIKNGQRSGLLAGPFDTREQADDMVDPTRAEAEKIDPMAHFMEFGTVSARSIHGVGTPYGRLNAKLGLPTAPEGNQVVATMESGYEQRVTAGNPVTRIATSSDLVYLLACKVCSAQPREDMIPFDSARERGEWATKHTAGTSHASWLVLEMPR
jgi:hypothetical protein